MNIQTKRRRGRPPSETLQNAAAYALGAPNETYKEIAERFGVNPGSLAVLVGRMQKGLDEPTPDEVDESTGTSEVILP